MSGCEKLAQALAERGTGKELVDVKFYVGSPGEAAHERLCDEAQQLVAAANSGASKDLRLPKI